MNCTRFNEQFSDEELATFWRYSGMGELTGDPEAPFPGRESMNELLPRFLRPIVYTWRDILRRAVRTMDIRRDIAMLRALLRRIAFHWSTPAPLTAPTPAVLTSQCQRITVAPTRGSPVGLPRRRGPDLM